MRYPRSIFIGAIFIGAILLFFFCHPRLLEARVPDNGYSQTLESFRRVACEDEDLFEYKKGLIRGLNYTNKKVLRALARLEFVTPQGLATALEKLLTEEISYDNLLVLERFVTLKGADMETSWQLLATLGTLGYSQGRVMTSFRMLDMISASEFLDYVDRIGDMGEPAGWALKAFLVLPGQSGTSVSRAMDRVEVMTEKQQWAMEECCKVAGMNAFRALEIIDILARLNESDAWNARGLFRQGLTPKMALSWSRYYFGESQQDKEWLFLAQSPSDKALLLKGLAEASDYLTWKVNNLHSVTTSRGREISRATLRASSPTALIRLWNRLDGKVRERYRDSFFKALSSGKKDAAIVVMRKATVRARVQVAYDSTTVNIYILLSKGSELYDSSFRDILVPVLKERIDNAFQGNLLRFLLDVDPENNHVSDFIISLAQRGKLAIFFPTDSEEQERVLDLVTQSAFRDENSLILFSATFMTLLETIEPDTRSYLIAQMLSAIRTGSTVFRTQLRVILQYYLEYYAKYVDEDDTKRIRRMMYEYGAIPLQWYAKTAFKEWKSDALLSSLSVFHDDDDGRQSYLSNCRFLSRQGYRPRLSTSFFLGASPQVQGEAKTLLASYATRPTKTLAALFRLQSRNPLVLDWVKVVNGIEISHSVYLFQGDGLQGQLLKQFLVGGHEMFAQRGHSYWRSEQLIDPIRKLVASGRVSAADLAQKQRFMSLGSCGGIRAYSELAALFNNNVDILATVGTGKAVINNPYNEFLFEAVAKANKPLTWDDLSERSAKIFKQGLGEDYLQPGSLPAILHKIMDQKTIDHGTD